MTHNSDKALIIETLIELGMVVSVPENLIPYVSGAIAKLPPQPPTEEPDVPI